MRVQNIDLTIYKKMKTAGLWSVVKNTQGTAIKMKQFNQYTGVEMPSVLSYFDLPTVIKERDIAKQTNTNYTELINDTNLL